MFVYHPISAIRGSQSAGEGGFVRGIEQMQAMSLAGSKVQIHLRMLQLHPAVETSVGALHAHGTAAMHRVLLA